MTSHPADSAGALCGPHVAPSARPLAPTNSTPLLTSMGISSNVLHFIAKCVYTRAIMTTALMDNFLQGIVV